MADPGVIIPEVAQQLGNDDISAMEEEEEEDEEKEAVIKKEIDEDMISSLPPMVSITRVPKVKADPGAAAATPLLKIRSDLGGVGGGGRGTPPPLLRVGGMPARPSLPPMPRLRLGAVRGTGPTAGGGRIPPAAAGYPLNGMANHHHPHSMMQYSAANLLSMQQQQRPIMSQSMMMAANAQQLPIIAGTMSLSRGAAMQQQRQLASLQQQEQLLLKQQHQRQLQQQRLAAIQQQQRAATGMVRQRTTFSPSMLPTVNRPVQVHIIKIIIINITLN
jgi:hypothetical protein